MGLRVPVSARLGVGLIVLGIAAYAGIDHWMNTRITHPVDIPVSLARGHIHTGPFRLNLSAVYEVTVAIPSSWKWEQAHPDCNPYQHLQTSWTLYQNGKTVDRLDRPTTVPWPTFFEGRSGIYELDFEVLDDFRCLDPINPHLEIFARSENYESGAFAGKVVAITALYIGICSLAFGPLVHAVFSSGQSDHLTDSTTAIGQNFQWAQRLPLCRPFGGLPAFGVFAAMLFAVLAILMMLLTAGFQETSIGWRVHLLKPGQSPQKCDAWTDPLIVLLKDAGPGQETKVFVNSTQVEWDNLDTTLKHELAGRREWTVYVGGDDGVPWVSVMNAIDIARGDHAKVFLITSKNPH